MKVAEIFLSILPWSFLIWTTITWKEQKGESWGWSLVGLSIFSTLSMEYFKFNSIPNFSYDKKNCNWFGIEPNGKYLSLIIRCVALILINIQIFIFLDTSNGWGDITQQLTNNETTIVLPDDFSKFTYLAQSSAICYAVSGLILLITLCQCGTRKQKDDKAEYLRWGLHDLILGSIWIALAYQFHDVVDDYDDSHWRHLFSSMIVFHVIILLLDIMSNPKYQINTDSQDVRLWSDETKPIIKEITRFIMYGIIYYCILNRLHESDLLLVKMSLNISSMYAIIIACGGIILINISDSENNPNKQLIQDARKSKVTNSEIKLSNTPLTYGGGRLNF
tara:strand:- start:722 stop:1723 length:1002 start_codon:yes stop_codon:yes gene_type:complete